ncbi:MAG: Rieske 2Fe-2S domain-containing protein [Gammaproteobacteria bacterium]|nr:Rieske 2Fe-2S domain-containing protein [Gammaproteobacteria bacterium]
MTELDLARVLCRLDDIGHGGARGVVLAHRGWPLRGLVVRLANGELRGYLNWCPHRGHPLNLRPHEFLTPDGAALQCRSHGAIFTKDTGACIAGPCNGRSLRPVPLQIVDQYVLLSQSVDIDQLAASIDRS